MHYRLIRAAAKKELISNSAMDPLPATWSSQLEDSTLLLHHLQMKPSITNYEPRNFISFSCPEKICSPPSALTFCPISKETLPFHEVPFSIASINPSTTHFTSIGKSNPNDPCRLIPKQTVQKEVAAVEEEMICFGSRGGFSAINSEELLCHDQLQPIKKAGSVTRTPLQAKYHVIAERKRREKLLQHFIALSAVVPGLKKLSKLSVMDGAIDHLKQLENRLKALQEEGEASKPCIIYGYFYDQDHESSSSSQPSDDDENLIKTMGFDDHQSHSIRNMNIQVRILKGEVLIRVTCENRTGFREEKFVREMNKLNLSVTKSRFMRFGGNDMIALSAVAKMKGGFCMTEEELANATRLAVLNLI